MRVAMSRDQDIDRALFLLDCLISKVNIGPVSGDPTAFILLYRVDEEGADKVMNEVGSIAEGVKQGQKVTGMDALRRILAVYPYGNCPGRSP
jgi:hypothetical protein